MRHLSTGPERRRCAPSASLTAVFRTRAPRSANHAQLRLPDRRRSRRRSPRVDGVSLSYPHKLGIALSGLGLATCTAAAARSSRRCRDARQNSIMGFGDATAEISLGSDVVGEPVPLTILRAPDEEGHISLLFDAVGTTPLNTSAVFPGALLPAPAPFGGQVSIDVPLIPSLPGAPMSRSCACAPPSAPAGVTYFEHRSKAEPSATSPRASCCPPPARRAASRSPRSSALWTASTRARGPRSPARRRRRDGGGSRGRSWGGWAWAHPTPFVAGDTDLCADS